jgi:hypothetical protein
MIAPDSARVPAIDRPQMARTIPARQAKFLKAVNGERFITVKSIGRINTLFSLFHQEKEDIHDAVQPWGIRNLTDFRRHAQNCSFPPVNPAKFQPSDKLILSQP